MDGRPLGWVLNMFGSDDSSGISLIFYIVDERSNETPVGQEFLLLGGANFKLLDGTDFLLL